MHAELTMNVTNEAPSSTHEWRADWGGEKSICLLSFGAGYVARYLWLRPAIDTRPMLAALDGAARVGGSRYGSTTTIDPASAISKPCLPCPRFRLCRG